MPLKKQTQATQDYLWEPHQWPIRYGRILWIIIRSIPSGLIGIGLFSPQAMVRCSYMDCCTYQDTMCRSMISKISVNGAREHQDTLKFMIQMELRQLRGL